MAESVARTPGFRDVAELCKLRVNVLVSITATIGFLLGTPKGGPIDAGILAATLAGTFLLACASSAWNQVFERDFDKLMDRTSGRPVAGGRVRASTASIGAGVACAAGLFALWMLVNPLTAWVGAATVVVYILLYTPLKQRSPFSLLVGAVAGALPPVMGWTASGAVLGSGAYVLFAILFFWQVPHFHAIGWLYREEYRRGGFRLLSVVRPDGRAVGVESTVHGVLLVVTTMLPVVFGLASDWLLWVNGALGAVFLVITVFFSCRRDRISARWLLYGSLIYLPLVLVLWVIATE